MAASVMKDWVAIKHPNHINGLMAFLFFPGKTHLPLHTPHETFQSVCGVAHGDSLTSNEGHFAIMGCEYRVQCPFYLAACE